MVYLLLLIVVVIAWLYWQSLSTNRRLRKELETMDKQQCEALNATPDTNEFLAKISHEIRTPMNGVIGMSRLLLDTRLDNEQRDLAQTISGSADVLLKIIDDVLDYSKAASGKLELESIPFNLRECLESAVAVVSSQAIAKNLSLTVEWAISVPETVIGDHTRLRQILLNLLGNAVKFTDQGSVKVRIDHASNPGSDSNDEDMLEISVHDTGVGIAKHDQDKLFESFSQGDVSTTRKHGGTGLGLAICKHYVALMGGSITLESSPQQGSIFSFIARLPAMGDIKALTGPFDLSSLREKNALILGERSNEAISLQAQLIAWRMNVEWITPLSANFEQNFKYQPDVLFVVDTSVNRSVDSIDPFQNLPDQKSFDCIVLTSKGQEAEFRKAVPAAKQIHVLGMPYRQQALYSALFNAITGAMPPEHTTHKSLVYQSSSLPEQTARRHPLNILLADNNATNRKLGRLLLKRLGYKIETANGGKEVVELATSGHFDVILMDIEMPDLDGLQASRLLREILPSDRLQIIALTANAHREMRHQCRAAGMDDYLSKPIVPDTLRESLLRASDRLLRHTNTSEEPSAQVLDSAKLQELLSLIGGSQQALLELIECFVCDLGDLKEDVRNGVDTRDADRLRQAAHTLKSGANDFGAVILSEMAKGMEQNATAQDWAKIDKEFAALLDATNTAEHALSQICEQMRIKKD